MATAVRETVQWTGVGQGWPAERRRVALVVEYNGSRYHGFQLQANAPTIQEALEAAIARLTLEPCRVAGAGRTDAGVHALGQVVAFSTSSRLPSQVFVRGVNHFLPQDIAVQAAYDVPADFDPRRHAYSRVYRYTLLNQAERSPLLEQLAYRIASPLDDGAMAQALCLTEGVHDFAAWSGPLPWGASTTRHIRATRLWREGWLVHVQVEGNAFLPQQVRRMAGTVVAVGTGRLSLEGVQALLERRQRPLSWMAPALSAHALCLMQVNYKDFPSHAETANEDVLCQAV